METKFKAAISGFPGPIKPYVAMQNVIGLWEKGSFENVDACMCFLFFA